MPNANAMRSAEALRDELRYTLAIDGNGEPLTYKAREMTWAEWEAGKSPDQDTMTCPPDEVTEEEPAGFVTRRGNDVEWRCDSKMTFRGVRIRFDNEQTVPCYLFVNDRHMRILCSDASISFYEERHQLWLEWAEEEFSQHLEAAQ